MPSHFILFYDLFDHDVFLSCQVIPSCLASLYASRTPPVTRLYSRTVLPASLEPEAAWYIRLAIDWLSDE
jgi:hypothetical protein